MAYASGSTFHVIAGFTKFTDYFKCAYTFQYRFYKFIKAGL